MLAKSKLNAIEVLISKALIDSNISHDGFVLKYEIYIIMKWLKHFMEDLILFMKKMLSYTWKSGKNTESKNPKIARTKIRRIMLLSKCAQCDSKIWNLLKSKKPVDYQVV